MDRKVVKIAELHKLRGIANIATFLTMELDSYIELVMIVEQYIETQTDEKFDQLCEILEECRSQYPNFNEARQSQIQLLIETGHLKVSNISEDEMLQLYGLSIESEDINGSSNIVKLFPDDIVDKKE